MDKVYTYRTACRRDVRLTRHITSFTLAEDCPTCEARAGISLEVLEKTCKQCTRMEEVPVPKGKAGGIELPLVVTAPPGSALPPAAVPDSLADEAPGSVVEPEPAASVVEDPTSASMSVVEQASVEQPLEDMSPKSQPADMSQAAAPVSAPPAATPALASSAFLPNAGPGGAAYGSPTPTLLGSLLGGLKGEEAVDIDAALKTVPGLTGGPSVGGFSWHTLEPCMRCWRLAYYLHALGLQPKQRSAAFGFGSLYHACWEVWYTSGGQRRYDEPCDAVRRAGAPKLAGEVQRLVYTELMKYAKEEADTWDIRAIEHNAVFWGEPERINGKLVHIPYSCRHDMLIGKREAGAACAPPGPVPNGIWVVDRKCLHHDELVWSADGSRKPARECTSGSLLPSVRLVENSQEATLRIDEARFSDNGIRDVFRLQLDSGRVIRRTAEEPVWTSRGWRKIVELQPGEWVACAPLTEVVGHERVLDGEVESLGYLIGDGTLRGDGVRLSTHRPDLLARFTAVLDQLGDAYTTSGPAEDGEYTCRLQNASGVYAAVENAGLMNKRAPAKFVPAAVVGSTKRQIAIFLAALWSTDGEVRLNASGPDRSLVARYSTRSAQLAIDVQQLLWRLGIWSTRRSASKTYRGQPFVQWEVEISGRRDKRLFVRLLGDKIIYRDHGVSTDVLDENLDRRETCGRDADGIPAHLVVDALQKRAQRTGEKRIGGRYIREFVDKSRRATVARWLVRELAQHAPELQHLADSPLRWDRVVKCETDGPAPTIAVELPENPVYVSAEGVVTHNTASALTYDLTKGYAMDGQFLMNALVYTRSQEEREFGPFRGMMFAVAVKHKEPSAEKSYFRVETAVEPDTLEEFYQLELRSIASELYRRLSTPEIKGDVTRWPKNRAACVGRYGLCKYFDLCDVGGMSIMDALFTVDPDHVFNLERLAEPPPEVKRATRAGDPTKVAAEEARKQKLEEKRQIGNYLLARLRDSLLTLEQFKTETYLVANHTPKTVLDQLVQTLKTLWPVGTIFDYPDSNDGSRQFKIAVVDKGFAWELRPEDAKTLIAKGNITHKNMAEAICKDWWDVSKFEPTLAR